MANCEINIGDLYEIRERMMYGYRVLLSCRNRYDVGFKQLKVMRFLESGGLDFNYTRNSLALIKYRGFLHFVYDDK